MKQLGLNIRLADTAVFDSFYPGENQNVVDYLESLQGQEVPVVWLWGATASGKSHLLQACCGATQNAFYLPCRRQDPPLQSSILKDLDDFSLVCLDDFGDRAGDELWEQGVFGLFNSLAESKGTLLVSADSPPSEIAFKLPDLLSRLSWGPVFRLQTLDDQALAEALQLRSDHRGFELPDETARFLLNRYPRDISKLMGLLDQLDVASLEAGRRLTIPFVKTVL